MQIHPNAFKHGLSRVQIECAFVSGEDTRFIRRRDANVHPPRWAMIGFDEAGRAIELVVAELGDDVLVFHANYLTKGFLSEISKKARW